MCTFIGLADSSASISLSRSFSRNFSSRLGGGDFSDKERVGEWECKSKSEGVRVKLKK